MPLSDDVRRLVRTVERLPVEDQDKILRMVDLLTLVPVPVQHRTQRMLRELLEREPDTKRECVAGVDDVLAYLERNVASTTRARPGAARLDLVDGRQRPTVLARGYLPSTLTAPVHVGRRLRSIGFGKRVVVTARSVACVAGDERREQPLRAGPVAAAKRCRARPQNRPRPAHRVGRAASGSCTVTGTVLPRTRNVPSSRARNPVPANVPLESNTRVPSSWFNPWIRDAVFTMSPIARYS